MNPPPDCNEAPECDFWDFVACSKCHLPFTMDNGAITVPFWITDCGHVICNDHLKPDQTCAQCGSQNIQLAPLQRQMEAPMSNWFGSITSALESVAFAAKFQQETMASQIRHYKKRNQQYRNLVERLKQENADLKRVNAELTSEVQGCRSTQTPHLARQHLSTAVPSESPNINGKRPMLNAMPSMRLHGGQASSSPRMISTPIAPNRLTLSGQADVEFTANGRLDTAHPTNAPQKPLQQYAYSPLRPNTFQSSHTAPSDGTNYEAEHNQANFQEIQRQQTATRTSRFRPAPVGSMRPPLLPSGNTLGSSSRQRLNQSGGGQAQSNFQPPQYLFPPPTRGLPDTPRVSTSAQNRPFFSHASNVRGTNAASSTPQAPRFDQSGHRKPFLPSTAKTARNG